MWQNKRADRSEILDLGPGYYTNEEYNTCLKLLGRVNRLLGGFSATEKAFKRLKSTPSSILEVGCGGGYLCHALHGLYPKARILGIDINPKAIDYSMCNLPTDCKGKVSFALQNEKALDYPDNSFDVVTTMLVCHHMPDDEIVDFLKESYRVCSHAVIINDLHRHLLAYAGFSLAAPFAFPNRLIWNDGRLSIRRAFHKLDWTSLLEAAGFNKGQYDLKWNFPFRWTLTLRKQ